MRTDLPSGTVTFLFTDIEGSTRLLHHLGPDAYAEALAAHRRALRSVFEAHGGVEVDTQGDAFLVVFPTAEGAAAAALEGVAALEEGPIRVRVGLHTGTPTVTDEGYVGADVHLGARVAALAHGGQVLLTQATHALLPAAADVRDLGLHRLKDVAEPTRLLQIGGGAFAAVRTPGAIDLPTPATCFVGRQPELYDAVATWYEREPRVLTIVGPGGTGKTRFAIELARLLAEEADGGTVFVGLAPLRDPELVVPLIAERLGAASADPAAVAARVADRRTHVLVDNVEQLLPAAARPLAELVAAAPAIRLLVTSREPLRIGGETELDLPPLREEDGVALFLERAHAVRPELSDTPVIHELVRRLDGLPLALELAAARIKLLDPSRLLERLGQRLDMFSGARDADERHATLRATIAWSHDLLDDREQELFARLAVFRGGFTLEMAEDVCDADLDTLGSLLDKSLLRRRNEPDGSERLWMLETIREFARERLAGEPTEEDRVRRRHAEHVLELSRAAHLSSEDQGRARPDYPRVLAEQEELRGALDWATLHDPVLAAEIVVAVESFWVTSDVRDGVRRIEALAEAALPPELRARLLRVHGGQLLRRGEQERGEELYRTSLEMFRELGDDDNAIALLARFAVHAGWGKTPDEARRLVAEVRRLNEAVGNPIVEPQMLSTLADVAEGEGDLQTAVELQRQAVAAATACGFELWALWSLSGQLQLEVELGLLEGAEQTGRAALQLATRLDDRLSLRLVLLLLARAAQLRGDHRRAGTLWGALLQAEDEAPLLSPRGWFEELSAPLRDSREHLLLECVDDGRLLQLSGAVRLALEPPQTVP